MGAEDTKMSNPRPSGGPHRTGKDRCVHWWLQYGKRNSRDGQRNYKRIEKELPSVWDVVGVELEWKRNLGEENKFE